MNDTIDDLSDEPAHGGATGYPLHLEHMLQPLGLDLAKFKPKTVKLVRHEDDRVDVHELYREGRLDLYQAYQSRPVFAGVQLLVSFLARDQRQATFVGVYDVGPCAPPGERPLGPGETLGGLDVADHVLPTATAAGF